MQSGSTSPTATRSPDVLFAIRSSIWPRCSRRCSLTTTRLYRALALGVLVAGLCGCGGSGTQFKNVDITGADYGKDFSLTDHTGSTRELADFRGKAVVMFFGYTHCPDVCPTKRAELKMVKSRLGAPSQPLQVLSVP